LDRTLLKPRAYFNYFTLLAPFSTADLLAGSGSGGTCTRGVAAATALEHASAAEARASSSLFLEATTVATFATLTRGAVLARAAIAAGAARRAVVARERAGGGACLLSSNVGLGNNVLTKNTVDGGEVLLQVNNAFVGEGVIAPAPIELLLDELARQQRLDEPQDVKVGHVGQGAVSRAVDVVLDSNDTL
jgi:hypothetical protein